ncbi:hypothetical protein V8C40DRAFT_247098 [Trichoderma camerunense]
MLIREAKSNSSETSGKRRANTSTKSQIMHFCPSQLGLGAPPGKPPTAPHGTGCPQGRMAWQTPYCT